jgi:hypothetical protein
LKMLLIQQVKKRVNRRINLLNAASGHITSMPFNV